MNRDLSFRMHWLLYFSLTSIPCIWSEPLAFTPNDNDSIHESSDTLEEVLVIAHKRLYKYSANMFEYDVAADSTLTQANLLQVMRKIPVLEVKGDGQVLSMEGLSIIFKINGLRDPMLSGDITQVLTALPASLVSKAEIKKVADKDNGIVMEININTKSRLEGYRALVSTYLTDQNWRNGSWGMSKVKRLNFSGNYTNTWIYGHEITSGENETRILDGIHYRMEELVKSEPYKTDLHNVEISASYDTDNNSFLSFNARGLFKTDPRQNRSLSRTVINSAGDRLLSYNFHDHTTYSDNEYEATVRWEKKFDSPSHPAYLNFGYEFYNRPTESNEKGTYDVDHAEKPSLIENIYDFMHVTRKSYATNTIQVEGSYRINRKNEIGLFGKMRFRNEIWENNVEKYFLFSSQPMVETSASDTRLKEVFGSIFPKYTYYGNRWEATIGVLTQAHRHFISVTGQDDDIIESRFSILPYMRLGFITHDGLLFELNYEMKSQVPDITALDPYINTDNPGEIYYGNPFLNPQKSHELGFRISKSVGMLYTSGYLSYILTDDVILSKVFLCDGVLNRTFGNIGFKRSYGLGGYTSGRLFPKTFLRFSTGIHRIEYHSSELRTDNSGWQWNISARCEQSIPWNMTLDVNANFYSSAVLLQGKGAANFGYGLSLYKSFFAGSLNISVDASSFIPIWHKSKSFTETENYSSKSWNRSFHAYFGLGISYSFGKLHSQVKQATFSIDSDEIKKEY